MSTIKTSIVRVWAAINVLTQAIIVAMVRIKGDQKYHSFGHVTDLRKPAEDIIEASGVDLSNGGGSHEL